MDSAMKWTIGLGVAAFGAGVVAALVSKPSTASAATSAPTPSSPSTPTPASTPVPAPAAAASTPTITDPNILQTARSAMITVAPLVGATYTSATPANDAQFGQALGIFQAYVNSKLSAAQLALYGIPGPLRTDGVLDEATYMALIGQAAAAIAAAPAPVPAAPIPTPAPTPATPAPTPTPAPAPINMINPSVFAPV